MAHLRTIFCARGGRRWFAEHGLDWHAFVHQGLPEERFLATGCPLAQQLVERARQLGDGHGQQ